MDDMDLTPDEDLRARWLPTPAAVRLAPTFLEAEPEANIAVIPMYQPDKHYGIWFVGQPVHTVHGVVFIAVNSRAPAGAVPSLSWARDAACLLARERLHADHHAGTVAYATVRRDGHTAVFEDFGDERDPS